MDFRFASLLSLFLSVVCSGLLFGIGKSFLLILLNAYTAKSGRFVATVTLYLAAVYAALLFVPLAFLGGAALWMGKPVFSATLGLIFLLLGADSLAHSVILRHTCPGEAVWGLRCYGILCLCGLGALILLPGGLVALALLGLGVPFVSVSGLLALLLFQPNQKGQPAMQETASMLSRRREGKVLWFGIDGATWDVMDPLLAQGRLPHLKKLIDAGARAPLKTCIPTLSPVLWTSAATGKHPRQHGVKGFIVWRLKGIAGSIGVWPIDPFLGRALALLAKLGWAERRPVSSRDRTAVALWNIASAAGLTVGVPCWLVNTPVERINGYMVSEYFYPRPKEKDALTNMGHVYPEAEGAGLRQIKEKLLDQAEVHVPLSELKERFGISGSIPASQEYKLEILRSFHTVESVRLQVSMSLAERYDADLFMLYFQGLDVIEHHFWGDYLEGRGPFHQVVPRFYEYVDEIVGDILERMGDSATVLVSSDHGHEKLSAVKRAYFRLSGRIAPSGDHSFAPDGVFVASGRGVEPRPIEGDLSIYDLTPFLLALLGLPVGRDMAGRPVPELLDEELAQIEYVDTYEGRVRPDWADGEDLSEDEDILGQLRNLGYID